MTQPDETRALAQELARAAKELTVGMLLRVHRAPDVADFATVFQRILFESQRKIQA